MLLLLLPVHAMQTLLTPEGMTPMIRINILPAHTFLNDFLMSCKVLFFHGDKFKIMLTSANL
jgi:hypothetical protein